MASDLGLTMCVLSPSASFNKGGRMSPVLDRGATASLPKPAASPASSAADRSGGKSAFTFGSRGWFIAGSPQGECILSIPRQDQAKTHFRVRIWKKSGKGLEQVRRLLFHLGSA